MKILCFNWRDIKNPAAGGAEVYTHEILKRLAQKHQITLMCANFKGGLENETIDGVNIVRKGNALTVYIEAFWYYWTAHRNKIDLIIDECNTLPFFTALYAKEKTIFLIHQLAVEFWDLESPPPLSWIGKFFEPIYLKLYTKHLTITVSESTCQDLKKLGFTNIRVIENGCNVIPKESLPSKSDEPILLFVGRLKKAKKPDDALSAMIKVHEQLPNSKGFIIGNGYMKEELMKKAPEYVKVLGHVGADEKYALMQKAHVLLVPGIREGWGQVVIEANAFGTPCVGYDINGLRDSIKDGETGLIVKCNPDRMAEATVKILKERELRYKFGKNALGWSKKFSWSSSVKKFAEIIG